MGIYKLGNISIVEVEEPSGLRNREHTVYSFFEADRLIEQIRDQSSDPLKVLLQFRVHYSEDHKARLYQGVFRYAAKSGTLSLQQHILDFFGRFEQQPEVLKLTPQAFQKLKGNMLGLFEACATEQMFSVNRVMKVQAR